MNDPERLNEAIDALMAGRSPREMTRDLDADELRMLQVAQMLRGSAGEHPSEEFVDDLNARLRRPRRLSRRAAFASGLGALAAAIAAGIGLDRFARQSNHSAGNQATWHAVARLDDVPPGAVRAFSTGAVEGFVLNNGGSVRAISRICTHMGCKLRFQQPDQAFVCPCHGAEFGLNGRLLVGPGGAYGIALRPLPRIAARVRDGRIEVLAV